VVKAKFDIDQNRSFWIVLDQMDQLGSKYSVKLGFTQTDRLSSRSYQIGNSLGLLN
jgi:hypothetical protein